MFNWRKFYYKHVLFKIIRAYKRKNFMVYQNICGNYPIGSSSSVLYY